MKAICRKYCQFLMNDKIIATYCDDLCYIEESKVTQATFLTFEDFFKSLNDCYAVPYDKFFCWSKRVSLRYNLDNEGMTITEKNFKPITIKKYHKRVSENLSMANLINQLNYIDFLEWLQDNKVAFEIPIKK